MLCEVSTVFDKSNFLVYCIEIYKAAKKINGKEVTELFTKYDVYDYIMSCSGALHTCGEQYIVADIDEAINHRKKVLS